MRKNECLEQYTRILNDIKTMQVDDIVNISCTHEHNYIISMHHTNLQRKITKEYYYIEHNISLTATVTNPNSETCFNRQFTSYNL